MSLLLKTLLLFLLFGGLQVLLIKLTVLIEHIWISLRHLVPSDTENELDLQTCLQSNLQLIGEQLIVINVASMSSVIPSRVPKALGLTCFMGQNCFNTFILLTIRRTCSSFLLTKSLLCQQITKADFPDSNFINCFINFRNCFIKISQPRSTLMQLNTRWYLFRWNYYIKSIYGLKAWILEESDCDGR